MSKKAFSGQNANQAHASTLKKRSMKGRQAQIVKGNSEPAWFTEVKERAAESGVKPIRSWSR